MQQQYLVFYYKIFCADFMQNAEEMVMFRMLLTFPRWIPATLQENCVLLCAGGVHFGKRANL